MLFIARSVSLSEVEIVVGHWVFHVYRCNCYLVQSKQDCLFFFNTIQWCSPKEVKNAIMHIFDFIS